MISPQIELIRLLYAGAPLPDDGPVAALARAHPDGVSQARALVAAGLDPPATPEATRALFDRLASDAPEAGVALYSLGDAGLLAEATEELVEVIDRWAPLAGCRVLDLGCGIGRVAEVMAARGADVTGIDISPELIAEAVRRGSGRVRYLLGDGHGLDGVPEGSMDLVLAADSWPYIVSSGLTGRYLVEAARVLRPAGGVIVFNWSYRGDLALDASEAETLGRVAGFEVARSAELPFRIWDAAGFHLIKRA